MGCDVRSRKKKRRSDGGSHVPGSSLTKRDRGTKTNHSEMQLDGEMEIIRPPGGNHHKLEWWWWEVNGEVERFGG